MTELSLYFLYLLAALCSTYDDSDGGLFCIYVVLCSSDSLMKGAGSFVHYFI